MRANLQSTGADHALIKQATDGDRGALHQLLEREAPGLRRAIERRLPKRWQSLLDADDVLQETYIDVFLGIARFVPETEASFRSWLHRIALRKLLDALRWFSAEKRGADQRRTTIADQSDDSLATLHDLLSGTVSTPSVCAARTEGVGRLREAVQDLPADYREVVVLYDLEHHPMKEVATRLGCRPGAAFMRRARAHAMLARLMGSASGYFSSKN